MLINSLLLVLKHLLPLTLLLCFWLSYFPRYFRIKPLAYTGISLIPVLFINQYFMADLANLWQGRGFEVSHFLLVSSGCICLALILINDIKRWRINSFVLWQIALISFSYTYLSDLQLFLSTSISANQVTQSMLVGLIFGLGICSSIGILFYFFLSFNHLTTNGILMIRLLFLGFVIGQSVLAINLGLQLQWLGSGNTFWDSNSIIKENSELGYFLTALLGYEATPALPHLVLYLVALFWAIYLLFHHQKHQQNEREL